MSFVIIQCQLDQQEINLVLPCIYIAFFSFKTEPPKSSKIPLMILFDAFLSLELSSTFWLQFICHCKSILFWFHGDWVHFMARLQWCVLNSQICGKKEPFYFAQVLMRTDSIHSCFYGWIIQHTPACGSLDVRAWFCRVLWRYAAWYHRMCLCHRWSSGTCMPRQYSCR